jgi:transposase
MSTSILYHGWNVVKFRHLRTFFKGGCIFFEIQARSLHRCPGCQSWNVIQKGRFQRLLKTVPIGFKKVFLKVMGSRLLCKDCGGVYQERIRLADPKKSYDRALERYVMDLCAMMSIKDVAERVGMHWNTVKEIDKKRLSRRIPKAVDLKRIRLLGIDEISIQKGHRYLTIVVDLERGAVVWVGRDRSKQSLKPFFKRLRRLRVKPQAIAMDMWDPYLDAVVSYLGAIPVVYDRFHIISNYGRMLDELRSQEYKAQKLMYKDLYQGTRYLFLKGREKLDEDARLKLDRLLSVNQTLSTAYILKEELRESWNCATEAQAHTYLSQWCQKAYASGVRQLRKFVNTLRAHWSGLINYFAHPISTGVVEGINNKINLIKRKAYGYRDIDYFIAKIYNAHRSQMEIIG